MAAQFPWKSSGMPGTTACFAKGAKKGAAIVTFCAHALQRCGLELINIMNDDGSLNGAAGAYQGMDRFDARKRLWADMQARSRLPRAACRASRLHAPAQQLLPCPQDRKGSVEAVIDKRMLVVAPGTDWWHAVHRGVPPQLGCVQRTRAPQAKRVVWFQAP